ncbi:thioredoxin fold domain-containing protein [Neiella marina]|uniref:Thioredoxin fold domain-containing protein n=1 Tax=Neiella holothuriorum TaxID=2870530 RepID=A0ABS7EFG1_9GAMM|nr:thioredoxin fold domain-containing protein [Neiella holothuriorum]MBW8190417.1 thioredoxin fold domain-containing protein [Neiella holothuriorum]
MLASNSVCKAIAVGMLSLLVWAPAQAEVATTEQLDDLRQAASATIAPKANVASIAMIFQPDCSWCKKQGKVMRDILNTCGEQLNIAIVGYKASYRELRRELKHFDKQLPALEANRRFLASVEGVAATPTTLFFDESGELLLKQRGYIQPEQLLDAADALAQNDCATVGSLAAN